MPANYVAERGVRISAYTPKATALVAPAIETLPDMDYCRRLRHARRPARPMPSRSSEEPGSGTVEAGAIE